jgi:hypothetical protein
VRIVIHAGFEKLVDTFNKSIQFGIQFGSCALPPCLALLPCYLFLD